jgi:intracellular sulfur oxidation DsrE/DsrF family protein
MKFLEENQAQSAVCMATMFGKQYMENGVFKTTRLINTAVLEFLKTKTIESFASIYKNYRITLSNGKITDLSKIIEFQHNAVVSALGKVANSVDNSYLSYFNNFLVKKMKENPGAINIITDNTALVKFQQEGDWEQFKSILDNLNKHENKEQENALKIVEKRASWAITRIAADIASLAVTSAGTIACGSMKEQTELIVKNMQNDIEIGVRQKWIDKASTLLVNYID